jgi:hypothetical protein
MTRGFYCRYLDRIHNPNAPDIFPPSYWQERSLNMSNQLKAQGGTTIIRGHSVMKVSQPPPPKKPDAEKIYRPSQNVIALGDLLPKHTRN